ncbi:uncharacterized protein LAESUDRAFT_403212 [Laetiporus sulphureus 93-53]|uniref:Uncharacterized protein n=1 Tax=Laetiporus sulphureus 93-53 TaxID=1314785 RepID=A0A165CCI9_9APHY|nr:uncharacterized protein LAESUDRAFT_403212 [Laetiporus sulphureus 93-53]KZT02564.1 hypothetical protein LAESUDRAFT_403212 [Laetiporus sulphureus 93-53]
MSQCLSFTFLRNMHVKLLSLLLRGISAAMLYYQVLVTCVPISSFTVFHGWTPPPPQIFRSHPFLVSQHPSGLCYARFHESDAYIYLHVSSHCLSCFLFTCSSLFSLALDLVWVAFDC